MAVARFFPSACLLGGIHGGLGDAVRNGRRNADLLAAPTGVGSSALDKSLVAGAGCTQHQGRRLPLKRVGAD